MSDNMFCFQCEQTAGCTGCTGKAGVCGKSADVSALQDKLTGALVGLARAASGNDAFFASRVPFRTAFKAENHPNLPNILFSAVALTEQVFIIAKSAVSGVSAADQPRAIRSCSIAADSALFIWQPYVSKK